MPIAIFDKIRDARLVENVVLNDIIAEMRHLERNGFQCNGKKYKISV